MKRKTVKILGLIISLTLILSMFAGCGNSSSNTPNNTSENESSNKNGESETGNSTEGNKTLKIGLCDSITGPAAPYGEPGARGVEVAARQLNEEGGIKIGDDTYNIELVKYDNKSNAGEGVAALQKLTDVDNVNFVLGWSASTAALAAVQQIKGKEVSLIMGNARAPEMLLHADGNAWRSATVNCYYPIEDCNYMKENGVTKVAFFAHMNDSTYAAHIDLMVEAFEEIGGVEVVLVENCNAGERDFLTHMTNVIASGADAIFTATNVEESAWALRQLRELGSDMPMYTFSGGNGNQWLEVCTTEQLDGCYGIRPQCADLGSEVDAEARAFYEVYQEVFGEIPPQTATYTYDNFWILMAAYQKAGTTNWAEVNTALGKLTIDELDPRAIMAYEPVDDQNHLFDERGQAYAPSSVMKWDAEQSDWVYEATIASGGPEYVNIWLDNYAKELGIQ